MFGDQYGNANEAGRRGYGIPVPLFELTEEKLYEAISEVLTDPSYSKQAIEYGTLVTDEINKPLERAVWWIEYAMRYPGMKHLRSPVHDLHWTQFFLLDIMLCLVLTIAVLIVIFLFICKYCCGFCFKKKPKTD